MGGGALGLVVLGYMGSNANAAICLYVFVVAIGCCTNVGFNINHLDLAPNYAGILMGFTNAVASIGGVLAPTVCGLIVHDQVSDAFFCISTLRLVCGSPPLLPVILAVSLSSFVTTTLLVHHHYLSRTFQTRSSLIVFSLPHALLLIKTNPPCLGTLVSISCQNGLQSIIDA